MGIRTGAQYLESLRDGRRLFVNGEVVKDVTTYGPFKGVLGTVASLYDAQHDPQYQDVMTYELPESGERVSRSYYPARTSEEMQARLRCDYVRTDLTYGLMGRLTDFMSAWLTDCIASFEFSGAARALERSKWYHQYARDNDLCITHALIDPQTDRSKEGAPDETVHIVERRQGGAVVSGARLLSTLAPLANEVYVGPFMPRRPDEADKALIFALPIATEGLKVICRESYDAGRSGFDRPLSSRFDEGDAILVFDNVFVPDERLIVDGDVEAYNAVVRNLPGYFIMQAVTRSAAKLRFLLGLACTAARATGRDKSPRYQELIGEVVTLVNIAEGLQQATAIEVQARLEAQSRGQPLAMGQLGEPAIQPLVGNSSVVTFFPMAARVALEAVRIMAGSGALTFTEADYHNPELTGLLDRFVIGANMDSRTRLEIMKLVWDMTGEQFGSRQALYERYYSGDPIKNHIMFASMPKRQEAEAMIARLLTPSAQ
jgi:aromatic ring hydroxylase